MPCELLLELLRDQIGELEKEFAKASKCGKGTPVEVSDFRELFFNSFIKKYFPFPYRIAKGIIRDNFNNYSDSIDIVVLNPVHPYTEISNSKFEVILVDGVDTAIELKPDISSERMLFEALDQIRTVKQLRKSIILNQPSKKELEHISIEHYKTIDTFIFSMKSFSDIQTAFNKILKYNLSNNVPIEEQFDFIVINNEGIIANYKVPGINCFIPKGSEGIKDVVYEEWNEMTLAGFLLHLSMVRQANLSFSGNILLPYLRDLKPKYLISSTNRIATLIIDAHKKGILTNKPKQIKND